EAAGGSQWVLLFVADVVDGHHRRAGAGQGGDVSLAELGDFLVYVGLHALESAPFAGRVHDDQRRLVFGHGVVELSGVFRCELRGWVDVSKALEGGGLFDAEVDQALHHSVRVVLEVDPPDLHPESDLLDCGHAGDVGLGGSISAEYGVDAARVEEALAIRPHTDGWPWARDGALSEPVPDRAEVDRFPGQSLTPFRSVTTPPPRARGVPRSPFRGFAT